jgi:hypothetical protein
MEANVGKDHILYMLIVCDAALAYHTILFTFLGEFGS